MTGVEALAGLVMITWSASYTFLEMQRYWAPTCRALGYPELAEHPDYERFPRFRGVPQLRFEVGWKLDPESGEDNNPVFFLSFGNPF